MTHFLLRPRAAGALIAFVCLSLRSAATLADSDMAPDVLSLPEAAALLRVTPAVVEQLARTDRIPARQVGEEWRFARAALLAWLKGDRFASLVVAPAAEDARRTPPLPPAALSAVQARGPASPPVIAQTQSTSAPSAVGEAPKARSAEEVARRDQSLLARRGGGSAELGLSYARGEQSLYPVLRLERNVLTTTGTLRYGLRDDLQVTLRAPAVWQRTASYSDASIAAERVRTAHDAYGGDLSLSLLGVALREDSGRPNVIVSIDGIAPTGPGERALGAGVVLAKSFDPAVLFASVSYLRAFDLASGDARRSLAKHNVGFNFGYTYALNDMLALNSVLSGSYRTTRSVGGIPPPREGYALQLGMTWMLARSLFVEPAIALRIGGDRPDMTFSLNVPYSF